MQQPLVTREAIFVHITFAQNNLQKFKCHSTPDPFTRHAWVSPLGSEPVPISSQQLRAIDPRVVDRIDLLTVVEHELGHVAGLGDLDASVNDLMSGTLGVGIRRNP